MGSTLEDQSIRGLAQIDSFIIARRLGIGNRDGMVKTKEMDQSRSCKTTRTPQDSVMIDLTSDDKEFPLIALSSRVTKRDVDAPSPTPIVIGRSAFPIFASKSQKTIAYNGPGQLQKHQDNRNVVSMRHTTPLRSGDLRSLNDSHLYDMLVCAEIKEDYDHQQPWMENRDRPPPHSNLGHLGNRLNSQSTIAQKVTQSTPETRLEQTPLRSSAFGNHRPDLMESWAGSINLNRNQPMGAVLGQDKRIDGSKRRKVMIEEEDQADGIIVEQTAMRTKAEERRGKRDEERLKSRARRNVARLTSDNIFNEQKRDRQARYQITSGPDKVVDLTLETPSKDNISTEEKDCMLRTARETSNYQGKHLDMMHGSEFSRPDQHKGGLPSTSSMLQAETHFSNDFTAETRSVELVDILPVRQVGESGVTDVGQVAENCAIKGVFCSGASTKPIHIPNASELLVPELPKTVTKLGDGVVEPTLPSAHRMEMDDHLLPEDLFDEAASSTPVAVLSYPDNDIAITSQSSKVPSDGCRDRMASVTSDLAAAHLIKSLQDIDSQKQRTRMISFEDELKLIATNRKAKRDAFPVQHGAHHGTGTSGLHQGVSGSQRSAGNDPYLVVPLTQSSKLKKLSTVQVEPVRHPFPNRESREPERQVGIQQSGSTLLHESQFHPTLASSTSPKGFAAWATLDDNPSGTIDRTGKTQRTRDYRAERLRREDKRLREEQDQYLLESCFSQVSRGISSSQATDPKPLCIKRTPAYNARKNARKREKYRLARDFKQGNIINSPKSTETTCVTLAANHDGEQVDLENINTFGPTMFSRSTISEDQLKRIRSEKASSQRICQEEQKLLAIKSALERFNPDGRQNVDMDCHPSALVNAKNADAQPAVLGRYESSSSSDEYEDKEQAEKRRNVRHAERLMTVPTVNTPDDVTTDPFRQTKGGKGLSPTTLATLEAEVRLKDLAVCPESGMSQTSDDDDEKGHGVAQVHFQYYVERIEYFHGENKDEVGKTTYGPYFLLEEANLVAREILTPAQRGLEICPPSYVGLGKDATGMDSYDLEVKDGRIETSITKMPCPPRKLSRSITSRFRPEKSYITYHKVVPDNGPTVTRTLGVFTVPDLANKEAGMAWLASTTDGLTASEINRIKKIEVESSMRRTLAELEDKEGLFRDWVGEDEFWVEEHATRGPRN